MITVIIQGTRNINNTLGSLQANANGPFRVFVEDSIRNEAIEAYRDIEFVKPGLLNKFGKKSDLYWLLPSGVLVLTASWNERIELCKRYGKHSYCLHPVGQVKYSATNYQRNVGKWRGIKHRIPILRVTEA